MNSALSLNHEVIILIDFRSEKVEICLEEPIRMASDLDGLRASQLWKNQECKSERHASRRTLFEEIVLNDTY